MSDIDNDELPRVSFREAVDIGDDFVETSPKTSDGANHPYCEMSSPEVIPEAYGTGIEILGTKAKLVEYIKGLSYGVVSHSCQNCDWLVW